MGLCKNLRNFDKDLIVKARLLKRSLSKTEGLVGCSQYAVVKIY